MKTLMVLSAIPASGKSTWAGQYQATHRNVYIISSDAIRLELTNGVYSDLSKQQEVWRVFSERIHQYGQIPDCTVILDALNDVNVVRLKYLSTTPEFDKKILILFPTTLDRSKFYNGQRDEKVRVPEQILVELNHKFEEPSEDVLKLVDEVKTVQW